MEKLCNNFLMQEMLDGSGGSTSGWMKEMKG
jgi:hypothetical protein